MSRPLGAAAAGAGRVLGSGGRRPVRQTERRAAAVASATQRLCRLPEPQTSSPLRPGGWLHCDLAETCCDVTQGPSVTRAPALLLFCRFWSSNYLNAVEGFYGN